MIPIDNSVLPIDQSDRFPGLTWHHAAMEHADARPRPEIIPNTAGAEGGKRDGQCNCTEEQDRQQTCDRYIPGAALASMTYSQLRRNRPAAGQAAAPEEESAYRQYIKEGEEEERPDELTEAEKDELRQLQERDREVRRHEMTHKVLLGPYARGISYTYQIGPDGRAYAIGGSVDVETGKEASEAHTLIKAYRIRMAAMAVGEPSSADLSVAINAEQMQQEAGQGILRNI